MRRFRFFIHACVCYLDFEMIDDAHLTWDPSPLSIMHILQCAKAKKVKRIKHKRKNAPRIPWKFGFQNGFLA
ncbi:hypothetical protein RJT34_11418 [Clitoria ternatea]|uniref:Uncharacterized protein n=1 Tax=Clitoria ternatea TaxID=43366 RepID=A0AAN9JM17_CLITE